MTFVTCRDLPAPRFFFILCMFQHLELPTKITSKKKVEEFMVKVICGSNNYKNITKVTSRTIKSANRLYFPMPEVRITIYRLKNSW